MLNKTSNNHTDSTDTLYHLSSKKSLDVTPLPVRSNSLCVLWRERENVYNTPQICLSVRRFTNSESINYQQSGGDRITLAVL